MQCTDLVHNEKRPPFGGRSRPLPRRLRTPMGSAPEMRPYAFPLAPPTAQIFIYEYCFVGGHVVGGFFHDGYLSNAGRPIAPRRYQGVWVAWVR